MKEFYDGDFTNETSDAQLLELNLGQQHNPANQLPEQNQPFYVNAKQYHRILKRRTARAKLEEKLKVERIKKPYLHESRHKHAMRRPRGQGGRFLTAAEIAQQKKQEEEQHIKQENSPQQSNDTQHILNDTHSTKIKREQDTESEDHLLSLDNELSPVVPLH